MFLILHDYWFFCDGSERKRERVRERERKKERGGKGVGRERKVFSNF